MRIKHALSVFIIFCAANLLSAKQVPSSQAEKVAQNFAGTSQVFLGNIVIPEYAFTITGSSADGKVRNYMTVYNYKDNKGFVIVSRDDVAWPVLGYSNEGHVDSANIPWSVAKWLYGYRSDIQYAIENQTEQAAACRVAWENLSGNNARTINLRAATVSPLLSTKWNQSPYYNDQCPYDNSELQRTVVGCVATAMAQVIRYHQYPAQGTSFHSYDHTVYGTLNANFGSTTYNYSSMPNSISGANSQVATLSYHCGVSVEMNYGVAKNGGSGAYVISSQSPGDHCAEYALKTYFGYKSTLSGESRSNYTTSQWKSKLKADLDAEHPIIYAGFGSGGGHCFVLDGYDNQDYFHINWGWGGYYDGYFSIDALNPTGVGTGGGSGGFNSGHQAIFGIEPDNGGGGGGGGGGNQKFDLVLYKDLSLSASTVTFGGAISVSTNIYNKGTESFSGDYGMAVFDDNGVFVDFIETKTGASLPNGYVYDSDLVFYNSGNFKFLPGKYQVLMYYKPTSGDWSAVGDYNGHVNYEEFTVYYYNDIELYKAITLSTGNTTITRNKSLTATLDIANYGSSTISGTVFLALYDLEGNFVEMVNSQTFSLNSMTHYSSGISFTKSAGISADAGSYLMAVLYQPSSTSILVGSKYYQNPIRVTVQDPPISPDAYESNNTTANAYAFTPSYSSNTATINTTGSNFHTGSDYDYYKIDLPAGYDYSITGRVHDASNSGNGNTYTVDAMMSVSSDGSIYSEAYDVSMPSAMVIKNGGTFYVKVSPLFTGNIGDYLLSLNITRTQIVNAVDKIGAASLKVYPVPATSLLTVEMPSGMLDASLFSVSGQQVAFANAIAGSHMVQLDVSSLPAGVYLLKVNTMEGVLTKNVLVSGAK